MTVLTFCIGSENEDEFRRRVWCRSMHDISVEICAPHAMRWDMLMLNRTNLTRNKTLPILGGGPPLELISAAANMDAPTVMVPLCMLLEQGSRVFYFCLEKSRSAIGCGILLQRLLTWPRSVLHCVVMMKDQPLTRPT